MKAKLLLILFLIVWMMTACAANRPVKSTLPPTLDSVQVTIKDEFVAKVYDLETSNTATVWIASSRGIAQFDGSSWRILVPNVGYKQIAVAPDNALWTYKGTQVIRFNGSARQVYTPTLDMPISEIHGIDISTDGKIWIGAVFSDGSNNPIWSSNGHDWERTPDIYHDIDIWTEYGKKQFSLIGIDGKGRPWVALDYALQQKNAYLEDEHWVSTVPNARVKFMKNGSYWGTILQWWYYQDGSTGPGSADSRFDLAGLCTYLVDGDHSCYVYGKPSAIGEVTGIEVSSEYEPVITSTFLLENPIYCFAVADDSSIWGITTEKKLAHFDGEKSKVYPLSR